MLTLHTISSVRAANPAYTVEELIYQLRTTDAKLLIVHPWNLPTALAAAQRIGMAMDRIVLFNAEESNTKYSHLTLQQLIDEGVKRPVPFIERRLKPGEARTKLAFLSFSSGTTGLPKVKLPSDLLLLV